MDTPCLDVQDAYDKSAEGDSIGPCCLAAYGLDGKGRLDVCVIVV